MVIHSEKTRQLYTRLIARIRTGLKAPDGLDFLQDHEAVCTFVDALDLSEASKKSYYIALKSTLRDLGGSTPAEAIYDRKMRELAAIATERAISQQKSPAQHENFLAWPKILEIREKVRREATTLLDVQDYVLLCVYTYLPPVRLDYAHMPVVMSGEDTSGNFLVVGPRKMSFVFHDYKTAKKYGKQETVVPPTLAKILREWLVLNPSGWLFCTPRGSPMTETALNQRLTALFEKHANKKISVNLLRHSYVSHMRKGEKPLKEQFDVAKKMMHSVFMNQTYRLL